MDSVAGPHNGDAHSTRVTCVVIAGDDALFRQGLASLLSRQGDYSVTQVMQLWPDVEDLLEDPNRSVVVLDPCDGYRGAGGDLVLRARERFPEMPIIVLTPDEAGGADAGWLSLGASACVSKTQPSTSLVHQIRRAQGMGVASFATP